jgi:hypothetical protein
MKFQFEFAATQNDLKIKFEQGAERELNYKKLLEIDHDMKAHNSEASDHFPKPQWYLFFPSQLQIEDLKKFEQVCILLHSLIHSRQWAETLFDQTHFASYPADIKEYLSRQFGLELGNCALSELGGETKGDQVVPEIRLEGRISQRLATLREIVERMDGPDDACILAEILNVEKTLVIHEVESNESHRLLVFADSLEKILDRWNKIMNENQDMLPSGVEDSKSEKKELELATEVRQILQSFSQQQDLDREFATDQQRMSKLLHYPKVFHSVIKDHLSRFQPGSRQWLFKEVNDWLIGGSLPAQEHKGNLSRVFWIQADAGMGKSVFAATLAKKLKDENRLLGAYFCQFTSSNESASKIIRSWAAQCCENLCAVSISSCAKTIFERAFIAWDKIPEGEKLSGPDLFDMLLINPLLEYTNQNQTDSPPMVLLIDALDEILSSELRKPLLFVLSSKLQDLPPWVKVVVTSRRNADIAHAFARLQPSESEIKEEDHRHLEDVHLFVESVFREVMDEGELESTVALFVERSEGRFIYVSSVVKEIMRYPSRWTLSDLKDHLPEGGLVGWYRKYFLKMKDQDTKFFSEILFPVVRLIVCAKGSLTLEDVKTILRKPEFSCIEERRLIIELAPLFTLRCVDKPNSSPFSSASKVFVPDHKSVSDWLTNEDWSQSNSDGSPCNNLKISLSEGNQIFVDFLQSLFVDQWLVEGVLSRRPVSGSYFYRHAFDHFLDSSSPEGVSFGANQLFRLRVLTSLLEERGVREIIRVLRSFMSSPCLSPELSILCQLLELSAPAFHGKPVDVDALPFQILARLTPSQSTTPNHRLKELRRECENWRSVGERGYWLKPLRNYLIAAGGPLEKIIPLKEVSFPLMSLLFLLET